MCCCWRYAIFAYRGVCLQAEGALKRPQIRALARQTLVQGLPRVIALDVPPLLSLWLIATRTFPISALESQLVGVEGVEKSNSESYAHTLLRASPRLKNAHATINNKTLAALTKDSVVSLNNLFLVLSLCECLA